MPPIRRKQCCVPHCPNVQELSNKQFFKVGANLEGREKWRFTNAVAPKSQLLYCCEDHFDLPNDTENYIRFKYCPDIKLKLRPDALPRKKLPVNVCRLCLNLIYKDDRFVDISEGKGDENRVVVKTLLPEIDLSVTVEPVACLRCFEPLQRCHKIRTNILRSELVIVNCIKSIVSKSPGRLANSCEIDLFDEYNGIKDILYQENVKVSEELHSFDLHEESPEELENAKKPKEEIVIHIEELDDQKHIAEPASPEDSA